MARSAGTQIDNNFSKGFLTEVTALTFPQNSCSESLDCIHEPMGNVLRRKGYNTEINFSMKNITRGNAVISSYLWKDVSGDGELSILVEQIGSTIYFYRALANGPLSAQPFTGTVDLTSFSPSGAPDPAGQECQYSAGNGKLFVSHPYLDSFYVVFNTNDSSFTATQIGLTIRDFDGMDDALATDERPVGNKASISTAHHYNLLNQGWTETGLDGWDTAQSNMPSNADVMWRFRGSDNAFDFTTTNTGKIMLPNSPAPRGHYILNPFNKDRATPSGLTIANETTGYQRASTIAFFSGRVFYAGIGYPGQQANIYFSQIVERDSQIGQCYQQNDPTGEFLFDLLPSDGGVIRIPEAGTIIKLVNVPGGLCAFATNGIWVITGSTGLGFSATDYTVSPVSSIQTISHTSFVTIAGDPVWWNLEGIYRLSTNAQSFSVQSLTESTIKTFYNSVPPSEKRLARGYYNPVQGNAQWLFRSTAAGDIKESYEYDRILNLDTSTGAWYIWTIPVHNVKVHGLTVLENRGGAVSEENVTDNSLTDVTDNDSVVVTVFIVGGSIVIPNYKYIISFIDGDGDEQFTFAEARNDGYVDWAFTLNDIKNYNSTFTSGYKIAGEGNKDFQSNYVNFYSDTDSQYTVQGVWDFSLNNTTSRWSNPQNISSDDDDYSFKTFRRKIRGRGKALQLKVSSNQGSPFNISGWSVFLTGNQTL